MRERKKVSENIQNNKFSDDMPLKQLNTQHSHALNTHTKEESEAKREKIENES